MSMVASEIPSPWALEAPCRSAAAFADAADEASALFSLLSSSSTAPASGSEPGTAEWSTFFFLRSAVPTHVNTPSIAASETSGEAAGAEALETTWHLRMMLAASTATDSDVTKMSHQPAS